MQLSKRQFLKTGLAGGLLITGVSMSHGIFWGSATKPFQSTKVSFSFLTANDINFFKAIIPVILESPTRQDISSEQQLDICLRIDTLITKLTPSVQQEIRSLLQILTFSLTRLSLAHITNWQTASKAAINQFLDGWKDSRFLLLRSAYIALVQLVMGAWYSDHASWSSIHYPGPPQLPSFSPNLDPYATL